MSTPVEVITARTLAGVAHGFLGRIGGVSGSVHAGLNVGIWYHTDAHHNHGWPG